jgi:hypothetical protein
VLKSRYRSMKSIYRRHKEAIKEIKKPAEIGDSTAE